jgi:hypothetical protein
MSGAANKKFKEIYSLLRAAANGNENIVVRKIEKKPRNYK